MGDSRIRCPRCGRRYKVKALAKKLAKLPCPNCGNMIPLPKDQEKKRGFLRTIQATIMPPPGEARPDLAEIVQAAVPGAVVFKKRKVKKPQPHHKVVPRGPVATAGTYGLSSEDKEKAEEAKRLAAARAERERFIAAAGSKREEPAPEKPAAGGFSRQQAATRRKPNAVLGAGPEAKESTKKVKDLRHLLQQKSSGLEASTAAETDDLGDVPSKAAIARIKPVRRNSEEMEAVLSSSDLEPVEVPPTPDAPPAPDIPPTPAQMLPADPHTIDIDSDVIMDAQDEEAPAPPAAPPSPAPPAHAFATPAAQSDEVMPEALDLPPPPSDDIDPMFSSSIEELSSEALDEYEEEALKLNALGYVVVAFFAVVVLALAIGVGYVIIQLV